MKKLIIILAALLTIGGTSAQDTQTLPTAANTEKEPYVILQDGILTFYYGGELPEDAVPLSCYADFKEKNMGKISMVFFDPSFKDYRPTSCSRWFSGCWNLVEISDMEKYLNTEDVTDMSKMFFKCFYLTTVDVSKFNTANVTDMSYMFAGCESIDRLDLTNFNTEKVTNMTWMFAGCIKISALDISRFSTQNITEMPGMFDNCQELSSVTVGDGWFYNYNHDRDFEQVFSSCDKLIDGKSIRHGRRPLKLSKKKEPKAPKESVEKNQPYALLDGTTITLYYGSNEPKGTIPLYLNYNNEWSVRKKIRKVVFDKSFKNYHPTSCKSWFDGMPSLTEIVDMEKYLNTDKVKDMSYMFQYCVNLTHLDISGFVINKDTKIEGMFSLCENLRDINLSKLNAEQIKATGYDTTTYHYNNEPEPEPEPTKPTIDKNAPRPYSLVSGSKITFYYGINPQGYGIDEIDSIPNKSRITTAVFDKSFSDCRPTDLSKMFCQLDSLTEIIDMEKYLNTENVTYMWAMFYGCGNLEQVNLSHFDTRKVTNMRSMFSHCTSLKTIIIGDKWFTGNLIKSTYLSDFDDMFSECYRLRGDNNTPYTKATNAVKTPDPKAVRPYVLVNDGVMTFYYGKNKDGYRVDQLHKLPNKQSIKKVVFDQSFKDCKPTECFNWFSGCTNLTEIVGMNEYLNTENVTNMHGMFAWCESLTELDLSSFKTDSVADMGDMFYNCENLSTVYVGDGWTTSKIGHSPKYHGLYFYDYIPDKNYGGTGTYNMFTNCRYLCGSKGTFYTIFDNGVDFATIDNGHQNPGYFSKKEDYKTAYAVLSDSTLTFYYNDSRPHGAFVIYSDILKPKRETDPDYYYYHNPYTIQTPFWSRCAASIKKVVFDPSFKDYRPVSCYEWFSGCGNLTEIVGMKENLNTDSVITMAGMFFGCVKLKDIDLSGFNTSQVRNMHSMFSCSGVENLDLANFRTDSVRSMALMFDGCQNLKNVNVSNFNTQNTTSMGAMFFACKKLSSINIKSFDTRKTGNLSFMFGECTNLKNIDVSNIESQEDVYNSYYDYYGYQGMFEGCTKLEKIDVSNFNFLSCNFVGMFFGCSSLREIKLPSLKKTEDYYDTPTPDLTGLFYGCSSLSEITFANWFISSPVSMYYTFANCTSLKRIYCGDWPLEYSRIEEILDENENIVEQTVEYPHNFSNVFYNCPSLTGYKGTKYSVKHKSDMNYLRIDEGKKKPGYFSLPD